MDTRLIFSTLRIAHEISSKNNEGTDSDITEHASFEDANCRHEYLLDTLCRDPPSRRLILNQLYKPDQ